MAKQVKASDPVVYATMQVSDLHKGRRGKHHELLAGILENLENLAAGSALIIPLDSIGGVSLANLRSAVSRAGKSNGLSLVTYSDDRNFYIWKKIADSPRPSAAKRTRK